MKKLIYLILLMVSTGVFADQIFGVEATQKNIKGDIEYISNSQDIAEDSEIEDNEFNEENESILRGSDADFEISTDINYELENEPIEEINLEIDNQQKPFNPQAEYSDQVASNLPDIKVLRDFEVSLDDRTLRGTINRWLKAEGYQDVIWQLANDVVIEREVKFESENVTQALNQLMQATNDTEPARACIHSNKVVRIIPRTKFCE